MFYLLYVFFMLCTFYRVGRLALKVMSYSGRAVLPGLGVM